jgi:hypothetical protein
MIYSHVLRKVKVINIKTKRRMLKFMKDSQGRWRLG